MKKICFLILLYVCNVFADAQQSQTSNNANIQLENKVFSKNDKVIKSETCSWECRDVNDKYATQIVGFDFPSGKTYCKVFKKENLDYDLGIDASRINTACALKLNIDSEYNQIIGSNTNNFNNNRESSIRHTKNDKNINLSTFLVSILTLNPNIIDREKTNLMGVITFKNGIDFYSTETLTRGQISDWTAEQGIKNNLNYLKNQINDININNNNAPALSTFTTTYEKTSAIDGFNKSNMAYFSNLFMNMEKIYQHLQILIFVLIGGFFVVQISANKLQAYLENRGENSSKEPYLHKFYIPLFMIGTFFMPIPEANGMAHSTIMQNIIRSFALHSTQLADMANAIGSKTYMDKIYKNTGGLNEEAIAILLIDKETNKHIYQESKKIFQNICENRYDKLSEYIQKSNLNTINEQQNHQNYYDFNQKSYTKENISLNACIDLQLKIYDSHNQIKKYDSQIQGVKKFSTDVDSKINKLDKYFATREEQLGWINSILTPSSAILTETFMFEDVQVNKYDMKEATKSNIKNQQKALENGEVLAGNDDINDSIIGYLGGKLVWMMMPGAQSIKDFMKDNIGTMMAIMGGAIGTFGSPIGSIAGGVIGGVVGKLAGTIASYILTIYLLEMTFAKIPLLVCTTASVIAVIAYLVSLCKYFYISPFIVAFSLATKRMDKIIEFLISGISIFLKPLLIVLFIYLALFMHTLINELFIFLSIEQFSGIETSWYNVHTNFVVGAITGLLTIFGILSSSYIMWKLIISGPSWAISLIGIDGKQDDVIASGIESNLAKRAFVA